MLPPSCRFVPDNGVTDFGVVLARRSAPPFLGIEQFFSQYLSFLVSLYKYQPLSLFHSISRPVSVVFSCVGFALRCIRDGTRTVCGFAFGRDF